jgi:hypothetical protein
MITAKQGPNVKRLIAHRMSVVIVPSGGGLPDALQAMTSPGRLVEIGREATAWVRQAIDAVIAAPGNPYGNDDEAIAGEILQRIDERKRARLLAGG